MNKKMLRQKLIEYKREAKVDYAIMHPDILGDCNTCVNHALCEKYGVDSTGIWLKHWQHGMNAEADIPILDVVYVAHDITPEQARTFYSVFGDTYEIEPKEYNPLRCFELKEKEVK